MLICMSSDHSDCSFQPTGIDFMTGLNSISHTELDSFFILFRSAGCSLRYCGSTVS